MKLLEGEAGAEELVAELMRGKRLLVVEEAGDLSTRNAERLIAGLRWLHGLDGDDAPPSGVKPN